MLSKLFTRLNQTQSLTPLAQRAFRASPQMNKKPSIGDAVTILQSKVSNINQVVSLTYISTAALPPNFSSVERTLWTPLIFNNNRTTSRSSVL